MRTLGLLLCVCCLKTGIAWAGDSIVVPPTNIRAIIKNRLNSTFQGVVKTVTKTEIIAEGNIAFGLYSDSVVFGNHRFYLSKTLQEGKSGNTTSPAFSYRIQDIQKGDKIYLIYDRVNLMHTCTQLMICRRPGGRVPAPPVPEKPGALFPHEERMNAYQDFEEKGIPLPYKYDSAAQWRDNQALFEQMAWESTLKDIKRSMQADPSTNKKGNRVPSAKPKPVKKSRPG